MLHWVTWVLSLEQCIYFVDHFKQDRFRQLNEFEFAINIYFTQGAEYLRRELPIQIPNWQMDFENKYLQTEMEEIVPAFPSINYEPSKILFK